MANWSRPAGCRGQISSPGRSLLPPPISIAFRLIEGWFDQVPGPRLASLALTGRGQSARAWSDRDAAGAGGAGMRRDRYRRLRRGRHRQAALESP